jgi:hypothetical protein
VRIRRTLIAPAIITIGTVGALVAGPVLAITTAATPVAAAAASGSSGPDLIFVHT